jgi:hypothetical protein
MRSLLRLSIGTLAGALLGCQTAPVKGPASKPTTAEVTPMQMTITAQQTPSDNPRDPQQQLNAMVHLDIYLLDMPEGSVSQNSEFWKRVDEQAVGADNADRLLRNGIRCGTVPRSEGLFFSQFFDKLPHPAAHKSTVDVLHTDTIELQMEKKFDQQDLFFFNASNQLEGRSYDQGVNHWALTFGPTPRDPGAVRLTLCPIVYSQKTQMRFTPLNQEYETAAKDVDRIYDLGLTADVPGDSFMIIAPSSDASRPTSIGGRFLIKSDKTEKQEQVIVIVPTFLRMDGKPMVVREKFLK